jgi:15-cis-phytoene synthase
MSAEDEYCLNLVRSADKDRFLASLFAPEDKRAHLTALYAFNAEIIRARDVVSEPAIGEIRMQWWLDALDGIYNGDKQDHPVAIALARAIAAGDLPKHALRNLVTAHIFDFYADPMPTLTDLEGYLGETSAALIQMAALILAGHDALANAEVSGLAGVAYGMAGLLRALPTQRSRQQCFLPQDMLAAHGATPADVIAGSNETAVGVVVAELRKKARARLLEARKMAGTIKQAAMPAFLHVALTDAYLQKGAGTAQWRKQWILWKAARKEIF